jgi:hypothetical protein
MVKVVKSRMLKKAGVGDRDCIQNFVVKVALWKMEEP